MMVALDLDRRFYGRRTSVWVLRPFASKDRRTTQPSESFNDAVDFGHSSSVVVGGPFVDQCSIVGVVHIERTCH